MRALFIGHAYMVAENQEKIEALANLPGVAVGLVVPQVWRDPPIHKILKPALSPQAAYSTKALPIVWPGVEQYHWYLSTDLGMRQFRPEIVCVEQGAGSL